MGWREAAAAGRRRGRRALGSFGLKHCRYPHDGSWQPKPIRVIILAKYAGAWQRLAGAGTREQLAGAQAHTMCAPPRAGPHCGRLTSTLRHARGHVRSAMGSSARRGLACCARCSGSGQHKTGGFGTIVSGIGLAECFCFISPVASGALRWACRARKGREEGRSCGPCRRRRDAGLVVGPRSSPPHASLAPRAQRFVCRGDQL